MVMPVGAGAWLEVDVVYGHGLVWGGEDRVDHYGTGECAEFSAVEGFGG